MKVLLKSSKILDSGSAYHNKTIDILIENGVITKLGQNIPDPSDEVLDGYTVTPGLLDLNAHFNEPGSEYKEDLYSGKKSASFSGFTDICVLPNTIPVIESKSDVNFVMKNSGEGVDLWAIGALSESCNGENLTEILDLENAGAVAFSDGINPIWNSELLLKALQYVQKFEGLVINRPKDIHLSQHSQMNEGKMSTTLGMNGEPSLSETIAVKRDLDILRYAGGRLHFSMLSTAESVDLVKKAKKEGLNVTCDVAIHQLLYTEDALQDYDSNYKVDPPLRSEKDRKALLKGLESGVIDAIVSAHNPQDPESKDLEFDLSTAGICSLPTFFSSLVNLSKDLPLELLLEKSSNGPRRILGFEEVHISEGSQAKLAIIDPNKTWVFDKTNNPSKSINSPLFNSELTGKCVGIINGHFLIKN